MGLDSVELLMDFEEYFEIRIPDKEAEDIRTVQNMVDCICSHRTITGTQQRVLDSVFEKIQNTLIHMQLTDSPIQKTDLIFSILSPDTSLWNAFTGRFTYQIPQPINPTGFTQKISKLFFLPPTYDLTTITAERFAEVICINNYKKVFTSGNIKNKHEVYIVVAGITVEKIGIDPYEITPEKSFVNDMGIS